MENNILDTVKLCDNAVITLEARKSKNDTYYNCVVLCVDGKEIVLSFDMKLFNIIKYKLNN